MAISRPRSPLWSTSRAVITLVMLAMGRSVSVSRPHSTWPVAASASTAPLALTPPGAPVTTIIGLGDGLGGGPRSDGEAGARVRAAIAESCPVADPRPASVQAVMPQAATATTVAMMIHVLSRTAPRPCPSGGRPEVIDEAYRRRDLDPRGRRGPGRIGRGG